MMRHNPHTDLERWLAAEAAGDELAADEAFGALFQALPRLAPRPGFSERVAMAFREPETGRASWLWKAALAAAIALSGIVAGLLPLLRLMPIQVPSASEAAAFAARGLAWLGRWLGAGLDVWETLARVGGAIGAAAQTPEIATAMLGSALISSAALYTLHHLLVYERSV